MALVYGTRSPLPKCTSESNKMKDCKAAATLQRDMRKHRWFRVDINWKTYRGIDNWRIVTRRKKTMTRTWSTEEKMRHRGQAGQSSPHTTGTRMMRQKWKQRMWHRTHNNYVILWSKITTDVQSLVLNIHRKWKNFSLFVHKTSISHESSESELYKKTKYMKYVFHLGS